MTVSARAWLCRRASPRGFATVAVSLTVVLCFYYTTFTSDVGQRVNPSIDDSLPSLGEQSQRIFESGLLAKPARFYGRRDLEVCPALTAAETDIDTVEVFKEFEFQVSFGYGILLFL
nr:unnamed protein product [Callosobruchus chinensis]